MKTLFKENPKIIVLIIVGILLSSLSFVFEYAINYNNLIITHSIMAVDIILLLINFYYLSYLLNKKVGKSIVNSIIFSLLFFVGITGVIMCMAEDSANLELMIGTIKVLIYLAPSIIILLPVIYLLCLALG